MTITRRHALLVLFGVIGCAANAPQRGHMPQSQAGDNARIATEIAREFAYARQSTAAAKPHPGLPDVPYAPIPRTGWVNHRPEFCSRELCLELENGSAHWIAALRIDGAPVFVHSARGNGLIGPRDRVYIPFREPGEYLLEGDYVHTIRPRRIGAPLVVAQDPRGGPQVIGRCEVRLVVGEAWQAHQGVARAAFDALKCGSLASWARLPY